MKYILLLIFTTALSFSQDKLNVVNQRIDSLSSQKEEMLYDIEDLEKNSKGVRNKAVSVYGEYQLLQQQTDFISIDDDNFSNCCNENFTENSSLAFEIGVNSDIMNFNSFTLGLGIGFNSIQSDLSSLEIINYSDNGDLEQIHVNHFLNYNLSFLNIRPTLHYNISKSLRISLNPSIRYNLSATGEQRSLMSETNTDGVIHGLSFGDNTDGIQYERNNKSGDITNINPLVIGINPGVSYIYEINDDFSLTGNLNYNYSLNNFSENKDWRADHIALGISLNYNYDKIDKDQDPSQLRKEVDQIDQQIALLEEQVKQINLRRELSKDVVKFDEIEITQILKSNERSDFESINVYENRYDVTTPILNYIFFTKNSEEVPRRYISKLVDRKERFNFNESQLDNSSLLEINHNILNIIGSRMLKFPEAKLKIIASNDGSQEEINNKISYKRSLVVKSIIKNTFGIPDSNFILEHRDLPLHPTDINTDYGAEENRRVEFASEDPRLLSPILFKDKINREVDIKSLELKVNYTVGAGVSQIYGFIENYGSINNPQVDIDFKDINYEYASAIIKVSDIWNPNEFVDDLYMEIQLASENTDLARIDEAVNIPVTTIKNNQKGNLKEFYIFLPYKEKDNAINSDTIINYIKENYNLDNYKIEVIGYTDNTGSENFNDRLSLERAQKVTSALSIEGENINGGEIEDNNELPEGRFLNRRVKITIKEK